MNTLSATQANLQAAVNLAAGAPLVAVGVALVVFRKFKKLVRNLLIIGVLCVGVLVANNAHLIAK